MVCCVQAEAGAEGKLPSLSEMFGRRDDEWTCDVCMVANKLTATECVACTASRPQGLSELHDQFTRAFLTTEAAMY